VEGTGEIVGYRGIPTLASWGPVRVSGVKWALIAKIDTSEAFAPIYRLERDLIIVGAIALLVVIVTGAWLSRALLGPLRRQAGAKGWEDERLKVMVVQAVALRAHGEKDKAVQLVGDALALAEPGGFIRLFVDEGAPMAHLLSEAAAQGIMPDYTSKLLAVFDAETQRSEDRSYLSKAQPLIEPLSQRELEVLQLIAEGLSNREIGERLFLALITVKGHNQRIFGKLQVQRRTEAVARARELGLL